VWIPYSPREKESEMTDEETKIADENTIREHAYHLWEKEGRPEGRALDHWLAAKSEIDQQEDFAGGKRKKEVSH
jgi:hypothetical protein